MAHLGFKKLEAQLAAKGASDPGGLAATIGRRKLGRAAFAAKAAAGRKRGTKTRIARKVK